MRSTLEVIQAVHNGESVSEEELRLCILSMRGTLVFLKMDLARWITDKTLPAMVRMKASLSWHEMNDKSWTAPLEQRIPPKDRPGYPEFEERKRIANKVFTKVTASMKPRERCTCCDRAEEYNGYGSDDSSLFTCPKSCPCHD